MPTRARENTDTYGAVVYAKDLSRLSRFYSEVCDLPVTESEAGFAVLESSTFQMVIVTIPKAIADSIVIAQPPLRREDSAIKLVFPVDDLGVVRQRVIALGGVLDGPETIWTFKGGRVCDGHDPEGNVVQFRERIGPRE